MIPPPNVTGRCTWGTRSAARSQDIADPPQADAGLDALWVPGTDHAGIATQVVVERAAREGGHDRRDIGREAFVERVWQWKEQYGGTIIDQLKRLGASCDWTRERFTMDEGLSRAVREAFVRLYDDGLIYRGDDIVNWCPRYQTVLSDSEVEHEERRRRARHVKYGSPTARARSTCATTRLETMLGDTGIAVHPDDERYTAVRRPDARGTRSTDGSIPIVADDARRPDVRHRRHQGHARPRPDDFEIGSATGLPLHERLQRRRAR